MLNDNQCHICFFGTAVGKWEGTPICKECLSHRIEITEDTLKPAPKDSKPVLIDPIKLKPNSEWEYWKDKVRNEAYEFMQNIMYENIKLKEKIDKL